ncbi:MAG: nucleotidyltransferase family protein [bacterium]
MKAMILAAGLGTRLKPFTGQHPKALYEVQGKTLLEHAIEHLRTANIKDVIVNVHHFADQIIKFIHLHNNFGLNISISDETGELLETGGGVKKAAWFFKDCDCALVRNVDILSDLEINRMVTCHLNSDAMATLAVRKRETSRYFLFDDEMTLAGWENRKTGEQRLSRQVDAPVSLGFSGIQVLNPDIFPLITEKGKFSLTDLYLRLATDQKIKGYLEEGTLWEDIGKMQNTSG